jgi:hypothetical protein
VEAVKASYLRFGQRKPIVVRTGDDGQAVVVAGNHQLKAVRELGWEQVAVVWADDLTADEATAFALADNRVADLGSYDDADLLAMLQDADDLTGTGYSEQDLDHLLEFGSLSDEVADAAKTDNYIKTIEPPIYEPTGEQPAVPQLYDRVHTDKLIAEIQDAEMPENLRSFLIAAAERHTRFHFQNIAEYYAHSEADVQRLMERSALVVIDFDQALELGYAQLSSDTAEQYKADNA